jgi:Zn-dependent protease
MSDIVYAFAWYFVFLVSVTSHEAAHAWAAKKGGDLTAYAGGQVSLNPWPHIKRAPLGMVVIPIIAIFLIKWPFGFAVTPYDPVWAHNNPRKAGWMAAAGPAANLSLAIIAFIVMETGVLIGFFLPPDQANIRWMVAPSTEGILTGLAMFLSMLFSLNLMLFILNILPIPPLDGSGVFTLFLNDDSARKVNSVIKSPVFGIIGIVGLMLIWQVFNPVFDVIFTKFLNAIYWHTGYHYGSVIVRGLFFS